MKDERIEEVDSTLGTLFREERARGHAPAGSRDRVLRRLARTMGPSAGGNDGGPNDGNEGEGSSSPPASPPASTSASGSATGNLAGHGAIAGAGAGQGVASIALSATRLFPLLGAFVAGGIAGGVAVATLVPPRVIVIERPAASTPVPAPAIATREAAPEAAAPAPNVDTLPEARPPAGASPDRERDANRGDAGLGKEKAILDVARTALGRGDGANAFAAVQRHASEFPRGQMSEEREALAVQALIQLGRERDAVERGARFHQTYPNSILGPVVDAALEGAGE
jgi:hypothetical protein